MNKKLSKIQKRIIAMLQENTGRHLLDSGGAYGRNWERNQSVDFLKTPKFFDNTSKYGINFTYNVFWYLTRFLDVTTESEKLNRKFQKFYAKNIEDAYAPEIMETFVGSLMEKSENVEPLTNRVVNTYNYDNLLSQVLQYFVFEQNGSAFIILQIHGGCDVRGGYTDPQIFEITGDGSRGHSEAFYEFSDGQTNCTASDGENNWDSYDSGYTFEGANGNEPSFKEITIIIDDKVYNKLNGKRITFGNFQHWDGGEGEIMPEIRELRTFVQQNYMKKNLTAHVQEEFSQFDFDLQPFVDSYVKEIESHTLELQL